MTGPMLVPRPLFDLEAKEGRGEAKGVSGVTELKQMLCGPKCFVMSTTESVQCKSLSNQKGTWRNINIAIVNVQADLNVLFSGHSQRRSRKGLVDNAFIAVVLVNS